MSLLSFTSNTREYEARCRRDFVPPNLTLKELRDVVPNTVFRKNTAKGVYYVLRDVLMALAFFKLATRIDPLVALFSRHTVLAFGARWSLWIAYWLFQGLAWGGFWTLGTCSGSMYAEYKCSWCTRSRGWAQ